MVPRCWWDPERSKPRTPLVGVSYDALKTKDAFMSNNHQSRARLTPITLGVAWSCLGYAVLSHAEPVQTLSSDDLRLLDATTWTALIPSFSELTMQEGPDGSPQLAARGASLNTQASNQNPVVAVRWDGVELPYSAYLITPLFDLAEVRYQGGSDGVTMGRGAVAGVINVESALPSFKSERDVEVRVANPSAATVRAVYEDHLNEEVGYRVALFEQNEGSTQKEVALGPFGLTTTDPARGNILSLRVSSVWQPATYFNSTLVVDGTSASGPTLAYQSLGQRSINGQCVMPLASGCATSGGSGAWNAVAVDTESLHSASGVFSLGDRNVTHAYGLVFKTQLNLPQEELQTITSWRYINRYIGQSAGSVVAVGDQNGNVESNTFAEDVQLGSQPNRAAAWSWRVGAHYGHDRINDSEAVVFDPNAQGATGPWPLVSNLMIQATDTLAVFARANGHWSDALEWELGVRDAHLHYTYSNVGSITPAIAPSVYGASSLLAQDQSQNAVSGHALIRANFNAAVGSYVKWDSGYTGSGLPGALVVDQRAASLYAFPFALSTPKSQSVAWGVDHVGAMDRVNQSIEVFYSALSALDGNRVPSCPLAVAGLGQCGLADLGRAKSLGVTGRLHEAVTETMGVEVDGTYLAPNGTVVADSSLPLSPRWTAVAKLDWTLPSIDRFEQQVWAQWRVQSGYYFVTPANLADAAAANNDLTLRWALTDSRAQLQWTLEVDNAFNRAYVWDARGAGSVAVPDRRLLAPGRVVGLRVHKRF